MKIVALVLFFLVVCTVVGVVTWHLTKHSYQKDDGANSKKASSGLQIGDTTVDEKLGVNIKRRTENFNVLTGQLWSDPTRENVKQWTKSSDNKGIAEWSRDRKLEVTSRRRVVSLAIGLTGR